MILRLGKLGLAVALLLAAFGSGRALGLYRFSAGEVGVSVGGTILTGSNGFRGVAPNVVLHGDLLDAAIGTRVGRDWGLGIGAGLLRLDGWLWPFSDEFAVSLSALPVTVWLVKGTSDDYEPGIPPLALSLRGSVVLTSAQLDHTFMSGPGLDVSVGAVHELNLRRARVALGLRAYLRTLDAIDDWAAKLYGIELGVTLQHGGWRLIRSRRDNAEIRGLSRPRQAVSASLGYAL